MKHALILLLLTLCACSDPREQPRDSIDLTGAWVLRHVEFPSGTEQDYALDGDGTTCLIYDQRNLLYECNIATTPTGLLVQPTATTTITLVDKGGGEWLSEIAASGCNAVGLDWTVNMTRARRVVEDKVALQGNMDPLALFGPEETIRAEARKVMDGFGMIGNGGHVFNLGHGINQFTPIENVQILVDEVHEYSRRYH